MVVDKVLQKQNIKQHQIETELHYKHSYYNKVLVKRNRQQELTLQDKCKLAQASPALAGQQISGLQTLGGAAQTQRQSELAAQQQLAQQQLLQPLQAAQALGGGITGLIAGYPTQQTTIAPSPSMAQTALSAGATLAGIYGALRPR